MTSAASSTRFTSQELRYLAGQRLGRLATVQRNGTLQNSPVGFHYNDDTETIDIVGFDMAGSQKFRNVAANGKVAFVVDDVRSVRPWRVRCLEIRGYAEAVDPPERRAGVDGAIIRIHPTRIISFGLDDADVDPHDLVADRRDVG
ncbi:PPOX class F420-dependent oxidoreductase [Saccharomonospora sp. NPDC006951]